MAKVLIEETTLTAIGDAIRGKENSTDLVPVNDMATRISAIETGGGDLEVPEVVLTGSLPYGCSGTVASKFVELFPDKVTTSDITSADHLFYKSTLREIPFEINFKAGSTSCNSLFSYAESLVAAPDIDCKHTNYAELNYTFNGCSALEQLPKLLNAYPSTIANFLTSCKRLRSIPEDYFDTWNFNRLKTYNYAGMAYIFDGCSSLREIPSKLFDYLDTSLINSAYSMLYYCGFRFCYALNKVINLPVHTTSTALTSNAFASTFGTCCMLSRLTFKTNADGTPLIAKWKSQTIDLTSQVGYTAYPSYITGYNSGVTKDKEVKDDATYQALKNDPDWFATKIEYSKYNHDSAVETINSLPDTSATGTNTIKFKKISGANTDGGAIENLTAEEIAVAAAKGWTVTLS